MSLVEFAKRELDRVESDEEFKASLVRAVEGFASYGHSGGSAAVAASMLERLVRFEPLGPLTGEEDEWQEVTDGLLQNRRCSHVFKEDGEAYDAEGRAFRDPDGVVVVGAGSRVPVTFPYTPTTEIVGRGGG